LVEEERQKFPDGSAGRVYIGGFSQGCMVSLAAYMMYQGPTALGGLIGCSGMQALDLKNVPKPESEEALEKMRRSTPMFLYHGKDDPVLPFKAADKTYEFLRQEIYDGVNKDTFKYTSENNLAHSLSPREIREISQFMNLHMGKWGGQKDEL